MTAASLLPFGKLAGKLFGRGTVGAVETTSRTAILDGSSIRFSQSNVKTTLPSLVDYMNARGWGELPPIDVVKMLDGTYVAIDNTRLAAAKLTRTPVRAIVRTFDDAWDVARDNLNQVFKNPKTGARPDTWGEALMNRIAGQKREWKTLHPEGSPFTGVHPQTGPVNP